MSGNTISSALTDGVRNENLEMFPFFPFGDGVLRGICQSAYGRLLEGDFIRNSAAGSDCLSNCAISARQAWAIPVSGTVQHDRHSGDAPERLFE
ncbi:MAG: hypothetical protein ACRES9_08010, partial [Gammaproteobacteria bacterium]